MPSGNFLSRQQHEDVLEVRRAALALVAVGVEDRDARAGAAGAVGRWPGPRARPPAAWPAARRPRPPQARRARRSASRGVPVGDGLAVRHDRHRVGEPLGLLDVVRRHQDRRCPRCAGGRSAPTAPGGPAGPGRRSARRAGSACGWWTRPRAISSRRRMPPLRLSTFVSRRSLRFAMLQRALDRRPCARRAGRGRGARRRAGSARP